MDDAESARGCSREVQVIKRILSAALAIALAVAPAAPVFAQSAAPAAEKGEKKAAEKKLTPQQQKMKDCGAKWQEYKKEKNVKGRAEYQKFLKTCLKA
jgi:hypothetical protein